MVQQRTLRNSIGATGVGLHTGRQIELTLCPAPEDSGIVFRRVDLEQPVEIRACPDNVADTRLSTSLCYADTRISTVEHLMSALAGIGVDNVFVDVNGPEIPIMDGSASPFVFLVESAGLLEQSAPKRFIRINKTVSVQEGDKWASFEPYEGFKVSFSIDFDHPVLKESEQSATVDFSTTTFVREVSRARTFGFVKDIEGLQAAGLALGGGLENAFVLDAQNIVNDDSLRYEDESVRHKVLDAIGDLYLLGHPLVGAFCAHKSGHSLNNRLLKALLEDSSAWELTVLDQEDPTFQFKQAATG